MFWYICEVVARDWQSISEFQLIEVSNLFKCEVEVPVVPSVSTQFFSHSVLPLGELQWSGCTVLCVLLNLVTDGIGTIIPTMDKRKCMSECRMR